VQPRWRLIHLYGEEFSGLTTVLGPSGRPRAGGKCRQASDDGIDLCIHHVADEARLLTCGGGWDGDEGRTGLTPSLHAGLPCPHKATGHNANSRNAGSLNGNHVMGKPRRASSSMGRGANNSVDLRGDPGRLLGIDMDPAAERRAAWSEVASIALELDVGVPLAEVLGHPVYSDIRPTRHVVVQADGLAFQAAQAWGWRHLEIHSVRSGGHDLHLHAVSPFGGSTAAMRGGQQDLHSTACGTEHNRHGNQ